MAKEPFLWLNESEEIARSDDGGVTLFRDYEGGGPAVFLGDIYTLLPMLVEAVAAAECYLSDTITGNRKGYGVRAAKLASATMDAYRKLQRERTAAQ